MAYATERITVNVLKAVMAESDSEIRQAELHLGAAGP